MKKSIALALIVLLAFGLVGCSEKNSEPQITVEQIEKDLLENGIWIAGWVGHPSSISSVNVVETLKSQTTETRKDFWLLVDYQFEDSSNEEQDEIAVRYEKFDQGWKFVEAWFVD